MLSALANTNKKTRFPGQRQTMTGFERALVEFDKRKKRQKTSSTGLHTSLFGGLGKLGNCDFDVDVGQM